MQTINALCLAQQANPNWEIVETRSGGWQLSILSGVRNGATISYLKNPCSLNLGESGNPYQVNCKQVKNFSSLHRALKFVQAQNR